MRKIYCIIISCLFNVLSSYGQQPMLFHHLKTENGLLNNSVIYLAQHSTGFMWFGTISGLSRYNGSRFKNYTFKENESGSATLSAVNYLYCDSKKRL